MDLVIKMDGLLSVRLGTLLLVTPLVVVGWRLPAEGAR